MPTAALSRKIPAWMGQNNFTIRYTVGSGYLRRSFGFGDLGQILFQERRFLPRLLRPDLMRSNSYFPFDRFPEAFHLTQTHRTSLEPAVVFVPAGHFLNCIRIENGGCVCAKQR
jgi:hypothetical protein